MSPRGAISLAAHPRLQRYARFVIAGGAGFVADAGMLSLLLAATSLGALAARVLSIAFALMVTWTINRRLTFAPSRRGLMREGARYGSVGVATALVNYAVYAALVVLIPGFPPLAAVVVASGLAMVFSYLGYSRLVFDR